MKQLTIFDLSPGTQTHCAAPVRRTDPTTSKDAAAKAKPRESWRTVAKILDALNAASSYEVSVYAKQHRITISESRIRGSLSPAEMLGAGYVAISSVEAVSEFGNDAQIYRLTESGKALAREK